MYWDGEAVHRVDSPTQVTLKSLTGWSPDDLFAAGEDVLLHFDGQAWDVHDRFPGYTIRDILCTENGLLYLAGSLGLRVHGSNGWRTLSGPTQDSRAVWLGSDGRIRVGDGSNIWLVENDHATLEQELPEVTIRHGDGRYIAAQRSDGLHSIYSHTPEAGWVYAEADYYALRTILDMDDLVLTDNGGIRSDSSLIWGNSSGRWIYGLARVGTDGLLACGYGGTLMAGSRGDDGFTWNETAEDLGYRHFNALAGSDCNNIWAAEWWGRVLHYDGSTWTRENTPLAGNRKVSGIQVLDDGWVAAKGGDRIALRSPDGSWSVTPSLDASIGSFHAVAPDYVIATTLSAVQVWNGDIWNEVEPISGLVSDLSATASGTLYALIHDTPTTLQVWDGENFAPILEIPDFRGLKLCSSRTAEVLWIGGYMNDQYPQTTIYRYEDGHLERITDGASIPGTLIKMTELRPDDLFILAEHQVWRFKNGNWSREKGLPTNEYFKTIWSHSDCGVFVQGHPTFFKDFSHDE